MKKISFLLITFMALMTQTSCISDDSHDADGSININISGVESSYHVVSFSDDKLVIHPSVTTTLGDDDLKYEWYYFEEDNDTYNNGEKHAKLFCETKDVDQSLELREGVYRFFLSVTSKSTGYKQQAMTTVYTTAELSKGFFIFKEDEDGNSDYDLYNTNNKRLTSNVIKAVQGSAIPGKPRHGGIAYHFAYQDPKTDKKESAHCFYVTTENDEFRFIRLSDVTTVMDASNAFFEEQPGMKPYRFAFGYFENYFLTSTGSWGNYAGSTAGVGILGQFSGTCGSTHCTTTPTAFYSVVYWDEASQSIAFADYNNGYMAPMSYVPGFDAENTNCDCLTCGTCLTAGETIYFLLRNRSTGKKYMYYVDCSMWMPVLTRVEELDSSSNFANADAWAVCCNQAVLAYGVRNNKLYTYDLGGTQTEREIPIPNLPSGETITYVSNRFCLSSVSTFDYLIIGTQSGNTYHAYFYNMVGGEPVGKPELTIEGSGKLCLVDFCEPSLREMSVAGMVPVLDK